MTFEDKSRGPSFAFPIFLFPGKEKVASYSKGPWFNASLETIIPPVWLLSSALFERLDRQGPESIILEKELTVKQIVV